MITTFTPYASLFGGGLIGLAAVILMASIGRIAGLSGIVAAVLKPWNAENRWKMAFLAGAVLAPFIATTMGATFSFAASSNGIVLVLGGVIVGVGVTFGSGCTSGHGVCGMARLSKRSIAATATFMIATFLTVTLIRHGIGGWL